MKTRLRPTVRSRYEALVLWTFVLGAPAVFSLISVVWQWLAAVRFPLHQRVARADLSAPISILKPLKGRDEHTFDCLQSWLAQDYGGQVQILFGVSSLEDPVCEVVQQLKKLNPDREIELVECHEQLGANAKVSKLVQLDRRSRHALCVVSDADVFAPPDLLRNLASTLAEDAVGLANCFYRLSRPANLAMQWEALCVNVDFWSQLLQGRMIKAQDFALGAVMAMRRTDLHKTGGFEALVDQLADDYQLGHRISRSGLRVELCPVVVECRDPVANWRAVWAHQLRWQRTIRVCKPLPYALSVLANPLFWPLLFSVLSPSTGATVLLAIAVGIRLVISFDLLRRFNPGSRDWLWCWLIPFKDAGNLLLWFAAWAGNHVHWRGATYRLQRDGRLARAGGESFRTGR